MTKQTSAGEAWILPGSDYGAVVLPDGSQLGKMDANERGFTVRRWPSELRTVTPHPDSESLVVTTERNVVLKHSTALREGFELVAPTKLSEHGTWRSAIMKSSEAITRPAATAELLTTQSHSTMTVDAARAFLRGLPVEQAEAPKPVTTTVQTDPRAARLAEIEMSMKDFNRSKGYRAGRAGQGLAVSASLAAAAADPTKLKRLTEIRANGLALRMKRGESHLASEHKKLTYVLTAHDQTGVPLATLLSQIGADMSQIIKGA